MISFLVPANTLKAKGLHTGTAAGSKPRAARSAAEAAEGTRSPFAVLTVDQLSQVHDTIATTISFGLESYTGMSPMDDISPLQRTYSKMPKQKK
ncbi:hypothetical protein SUGI_0328320 [Cryptomeria japonica]|nr:hypothetical protein SUGI_0328320 [Cryptomeria japonica]